MAKVYVFIKLGYAVVVVTLLLMIWASLSGARELEIENYPPCFFNPLCTCTKAIPDLGIVQCRDVPLPRIPQPLNTSKVFGLHLENNGLKWIEPYFLQATGLYRLEISENPLGDIPDEAFLGLERSLWELHLVNDQLIEVPTRALRHLQRLRILDLSDNYITHLEPEDWRGLESSLQTLILSENSISKLPSDAFSGLPLLDTIDLRGNNLKIIDPNVFRDGLDHLSRILLGDNQLTEIPYMALAPLKLLRYLDLSRNLIGMVRKERDGGIMPTLSLDTIRLDYNVIEFLSAGSFQFFNILNSTFLDGNPIRSVQANAFRNAKIRELSLRDCKLSVITPAAFDGLQSSLQILDLSGNNLTGITKDIFVHLDQLNTLSLRDNLILTLNPTEVFMIFQFSLLNLDLSGRENIAISLQDLRRIKNLRSLSVTRFPQNHLVPEDFLEFGSNLEELRVTGGFLKTVKNHAFMHVHGLKILDLSDNSIQSLENDCFYEIGHSLVTLNLAHGFASSVENLPAAVLRPLINLQYLDLGNNYFKSMSDTSFHFLKKLRRLELQDNRIGQVHKGTFQGDIHSQLEEVFLSFNEIRNIQQHTFVDLVSLKNIFLDDNKIESINRRAFMNLEQLHQLILRGNKIKMISDEAFQNLPELDLLDLAYNSLDHFDFGIFDQVGTLSSFKVNVSHNRIEELRTNATGFGVGREGSAYFIGIGPHSNIKILDLSFNNISFIARSFFRPAEISLTHLHLGHNALVNASREVFGNIPHLQWLDLSFNAIEQIEFDSFRNTKKLQVLLIAHNNLELIPSETFQGLAGLRVVDFSNNNLRGLPDHLFPEEGLETLDVSNNELVRMPLSSLSTAAATTLCELDVSWNNIGSVSYQELMGRFRSLVWLDLSNNRILRIDDSAFISLPRLMHLDLSHNSNLDLAVEGMSFRGLEHSLLRLELNNVSLTSVPELPLLRLRALSIAGNELPTVPPELAANMTSLRYLDLSYNDLTTVPLVTHSLPQLRILSLAGNPITTLTNTSLLGVAEQLEELDIRRIALATLEVGVLYKMDSLRSLQLTVRKGVRSFNIPKLLQGTDGLRNLHIEVDEETNLADEMEGIWPKKLRNVTFSGRELHSLADNILEGNQSPELNVALRHTNIPGLDASFFRHVGVARNLSVDMQNSGNLQRLGNPNTGARPGLSRETFLTTLKVSGNSLNCDCKIGWIEVWERKKRQYMCNEGIRSNLKCRHVSDDLRNAICVNKGNQTLLEVLKTDIECGWGAVGTVRGVTVPILVALATVLRVF